MNVLDENVQDSQRQELRRRRIPVRQIGYDISRASIQDEQIIPLLHELSRPTFFTLDRDFYRHNLCHEKYCLVFLDVHRNSAAEYVCRLLRHPHFNTRAKRLGRVIRLSPGGIAFFVVHRNQEQHLSWP